MRNVTRNFSYMLFILFVCLNIPLAFSCFGETFVTHYHKVKKGESLFLIAKKYQVPVKDLQKINKLKDLKIYPEQKILVRKVRITKKPETSLSSSKYKYPQIYMYYKIKNGDSLWKISNKYGISLNKLKEINKLKSNSVYPGQILKLGYKRKSEQLSFLSNTFPATEYKKESSLYHTVMPNENLSLIAKKYGVSTATLTSLNKLKSSTIHPKQKILIRTTEYNNKTSKTTSRNSSYSYIYKTRYHMVEKGDSLWKISKRYEVPINKLKNVNRITNNTIRPGQLLTIGYAKELDSFSINPKPIVKDHKITIHRVKKGECLKTIAEKYGIDTLTLIENNLLSSAEIKTGQIIIIPSEVFQEDTAESEKNIDNDSQLNMNDKIIEEAFSFLNVPYKLGGATKRGIDCSTLARKAYAKIGISLPKTSWVQYKSGISVPIDEANAGDLVFFRRGKGVGHVGIYLGDHLFIHASNKQKKVTVSSLNNVYFRNHLAGIKRYIPFEGVVD